MCGGDDQRGLGRDPQVDRHRLRRHDDESREVLRLVGDVAFQHFQAVDAGGFFAGDRRLRQILILLHLPHRHGRVDHRLLVAVLQLRQKPAALGQRLPLRQHASDLRQRHDVDGQQAVVDLKHLFAHNVQLRPQQQIVDFVDHTGRRVLDRQHAVVGHPFFHRLHDFGIRRITDERAVVFPVGEVLAGRQGAEVTLASLVRDVQRTLPSLRIAIALQEQLLRPHRVVDDLVEDLGDGMRVQPQLAAVGDEPGQQLLFPMRVAQLQVLAFLEFHHARDQRAATRQQIQDLVVDRINAVAEFLEIHGFPMLRKKGAPADCRNGRTP